MPTTRNSFRNSSRKIFSPKRMQTLSKRHRQNLASMKGKLRLSKARKEPWRQRELQLKEKVKQLKEREKQLKEKEKQLKLQLKERLPNREKWPLSLKKQSKVKNRLPNKLESQLQSNNLQLKQGKSKPTKKFHNRNWKASNKLNNILRKQRTASLPQTSCSVPATSTSPQRAACVATTSTSSWISPETELSQCYRSFTSRRKNTRSTS
jgi:chromosome segregation ATPase